jgi:hypothetical protein
VEWTESQKAVEEYLGGYIEGFKVFDLSKLTHNDLAVREVAFNKLPTHLKVVYKEIKSICGKTFLSNPRETLRIALVDLALRLWRHCGRDKFAAKSPAKKLEHAKRLSRQAANAAVQRTSESQLPLSHDLDIRVKSSNVHDGGILTGKDGEAAFSVDYMPRRRADWVQANAVEDAAIAKIDFQRQGRVPSEEERETAYERVIRLLGDEDGEWYWSIQFNHTECSQRDPRRIALTAAERKRLHRLRRIVS